MNPEAELLKVPPISLTLKRLRLGADSGEWWKNVSEEQWATVQRPQQAPLEAQPMEEKTPPKGEPPKASEAPRSRVGRAQVRHIPQVRRNRIRNVKPTTVRA
jgi:hypothetical protein